jgi:hypothetical protein
MRRRLQSGPVAYSRSITLSRVTLAWRWAGPLTACCLPFLLVPVSVTADSPPVHTEPLFAAVHVHSQYSTGRLSLEELAQEAERRGIQALVLSDNLVLRYEYGLFPFRGVIRRRIALPSVLENGLEAYLDDVKTVQARHPNVIMVPGVEVAPHYYWSGSVFDGNLTMHDSQKNLIVLGLTRAQDYLTLPVAGLPASQRYTGESVLSLSPVLLLVAAASLWWRGRSDMPVMAGGTQRYRLASLVLGGIGAVLLLNAWPFVHSDINLYELRTDYRPYQRLIDTVLGLGGLAIWSLPEARDFNHHTVEPFGTITVKTDAYPEALILTKGYTAFGGLYEDTRHAIDPGGVWDHALQLYLSGERPVPPFMTGESAFHGSGPDKKELDTILTVMRVSERTPAGILEAIRTGRLYAVHRHRKEFGLRLDRFEVAVNAGSQIAESGEILDPEGHRDVTVRVAVSATDRQAHLVSVSLIRSGVVVARVSGMTPLSQVIADLEIPSGQWHAYRLQVQGDGEIVSNPVFLGPVPPPAAMHGKS